MGACPGDDQSGVLTLTSPSIEIPLEADVPRIALNHWFDIEFGFDGGNLKISVNGGDFLLVPGSAFETGPYTDVLFDAWQDPGQTVPNNTNPLADPDALAGVDAGAEGVDAVVSAGDIGMRRRARLVELAPGEVPMTAQDRREARRASSTES